VAINAGRHAQTASLFADHRVGTKALLDNLVWLAGRPSTTDGAPRAGAPLRRFVSDPFGPDRWAKLGNSDVTPPSVAG